jgi:hypothetical protein
MLVFILSCYSVCYIASVWMSVQPVLKPEQLLFPLFHITFHPLTYYFRLRAYTCPKEEWRYVIPTV